MAPKKLDSTGLKQLWKNIVNLFYNNISNSNNITEEGKFTLDAIEKNPNVDGTLAKQISELNSNLNERIKTASTYFIYEVGTINCFEANDTYLCIAWVVTPSPVHQTVAVVTGNDNGATISTLVESENVKIIRDGKTVKLQSVYGNACYMLAVKLRN